ncbi:MAG: pyrroline-5-carboxylate reductase [Parachlamydiaceae bacterium]|nr:pyrroline-5-carboxylate reductase [Parachlamydiaceae bacterium]
MLTSNFDKIAIIGCGNMGAAIAERLSADKQLLFYDRHPEKIKLLVDKGFGKSTNSLKEAVTQSNLVILAIKPQNLEQSAAAIQESLTPSHTLVSLLTSITLKQLNTYFPNCQIVRMMPNIPLLCGEGMIGLCSDENDNSTYKEHLTSLFAPLGKILWLPENKMDAFTALAGSGPAFVFAITEAMIEAGIALGFPAKDAQSITYQMIRGSINLLEKTGKHPAELKWQVTSPGGTTIAGLKTFEEHAVRSGIINTFVSTHLKGLALKTT